MQLEMSDFSKVVSAPHGFLLCIERNQTGWIVAQERQDDYSAARVGRDDITVWVQGGPLPRETAQHLLSRYTTEPESFIPPRDMDGSFVLMDKTRRRLWCGRDRSQAYHLYIFEKGHLLYVTTDLAVLCGAICNELDALAVDLFLNQGIVLAPFPLLKGVQALLPGHYRVYEGQHAGKAFEFWRVHKVDVPERYDDAVAMYGELLLDSIRRHVREDCAAVYLSGGSDSAAVVGALHKLGVREVCAAHMHIEGNFPFEQQDVEALQRAYGFRLLYTIPPCQEARWFDEVRKRLTCGSLNSIYLTFPVYLQMGGELGVQVPKGTSVFNGEMCLLDQGFNESSDSTRKVRRWLYMKGGRRLAHMFPVWPASGAVNWRTVCRPFLDRGKWRDRFDVLRTAVQTFIHAIGRPADYYAGLKLGFRGFPGMWLGLSLLPPDYLDGLRERLISSFFTPYLDDLKSGNWRPTIATMNTCWYSESSNFTMPTEAASYGKLRMCFPFSSAGLMDFAASLPLEWTIDKKIQKDMCRRVLNMPEAVAYRMKNHKQSFSYFNAVYGALRRSMVNTVLTTDYGPLTDGVKALHSAGKLKDTTLFSLYGLALQIDARKLKVC